MSFLARKLLFLCAGGGGLLLGLASASSEMPDGTGKDTVMKVCSECHTMDTIRKRRLNRDEWSAKIQDMVQRGAQGSDEEFSAVLDYLTHNFGPDSKIWVNTAPFVELKAILVLTNEEAQAIVDYRAQNGNFSQWTDLTKVPGMDAKKIEAKKDVMAF
jgi:competence protein ComEA